MVTPDLSNEPKIITCPHCKMAFRAEDIIATVSKGRLKCHVCGKTFLSPCPEHACSERPSGVAKYRSTIVLTLGILILMGAAYLLFRPSPPVEQVLASPPPSSSQAENKIDTIRRIAQNFHKSHTYTLEADFVCMDMAISVWNQLITHGIDARIMGGNVQEDITDWDYETLITKSNHAWVVAHIGPNEKVAIETTAGTVLTADMREAAPYFRGMVFDNPAQIKKYDFLRRQVNEVCGEANQLIADWNSHVAGKMRSNVTNIRQSKIEQRKRDCENSVVKMEEFRSRAVFR